MEGLTPAEEMLLTVSWRVVSVGMRDPKDRILGVEGYRKIGVKIEKNRDEAATLKRVTRSPPYDRRTM